MMDKPLLESLLKIKESFLSISDQLMDPNVISDIKKYQKLSKEHVHLEEIVKNFDEYLKITKQIDEAKDILENEKNPDLIAMAKMELDEKKDLVEPLIEKLKVLLLPQDPNDDKNVIVEIRGAAGGDEANIFAGNLFDIYKKWSANNDMKINVISESESSGGGFSLIIFQISGTKAYSKLKYETGVHRVQRIPTTETQGRVHTSTVTVTVIPEADDSVDIHVNPADLKVDTYRSSGAGGQHVNKTDSAVRMTHIPTGIVVQAQNGRSQIANRELALSMIKTKLYELEVQKQQEEDAVFRKLAGTGARSEKIRTYNYPQDRVTDHRIHFSVSLKSVLEGKIDPIINNLLAFEQAERLKNEGI